MNKLIVYNGYIAIAAIVVVAASFLFLFLWVICEFI